MCVRFVFQFVCLRVCLFVLCVVFSSVCFFHPFYVPFNCFRTFGSVDLFVGLYVPSCVF